MSAPLRIPMPLRVPELASPLGRLIVPRRLDEPWIPLDRPLKAQKIVKTVIQAAHRQEVGACREIDLLRVRFHVCRRGDHDLFVKSRDREVVHLVVVPVAVAEDGHLGTHLQAERARA